MRFQVPQFIEVEDKLFGPFTLKQFIYLAGSAGIAYAIYYYLPGLIAIPLAIAMIAFGVALAFVKPDGHRPFIFLLEQAIKYYVNPKKYVWKQDVTKKSKDAVSQAKEIVNVKASDMLVPRLSDSKLRELSWSLDIHEKLK